MGWGESPDALTVYTRASTQRAAAQRNTRVSVGIVLVAMIVQVMGMGMSPHQRRGGTLQPASHGTKRPDTTPHHTTPTPHHTNTTPHHTNTTHHATPPCRAATTYRVHTRGRAGRGNDPAAAAAPPASPLTSSPLAQPPIASRGPAGTGTPHLHRHPHRHRYPHRHRHRYRHPRRGTAAAAACTRRALLACPCTSYQLGGGRRGPRARHRRRG